MSEEIDGYNQIELHNDTQIQFDTQPDTSETDPTQIKPVTMKDLLQPLLETISPLALCVVYLVFIILCCFSLGISTIANPMYEQTAIGTYGCPKDNYTKPIVGECYGVDLLENADTKTGPKGMYKIGPFSKLNRAYNVDAYFKNIMEKGFCLFF